jgi:D-alanyl-D-alanine carboxypeptidase/D-alanyl-D-alanine-endopeptidase (penicillin-binding protein 4)
VLKDDKSSIEIVGYGDPTLGSWRYQSNKPEKFIEVVIELIKKEKLSTPVNISIDDLKWGTQSIPNGWIWEDVGNYYGAGASSFNWNENQYKISLQSGTKVGEDVEFTGISDATFNLLHSSELTTAAPKTGDNAYVFLPEFGNRKDLRGTIPLSKTPIDIFASSQNPTLLFAESIKKSNKTIKNVNGYKQSSNKAFSENSIDNKSSNQLLVTHYSPTLDSINYWFLKKSINLYGEAFVKTISYEKKGVGATDTGLSIIKYFWKQRGIELSAINIIDGSGLSPANRVTANALVTVMQYAKKQNWYSSFYNALPEINGIKMKDGYISGVRSYTGYVKSKTGNEYTFALIVNNFDGSAATVREKLWKVLDVMK